MIDYITGANGFIGQHLLQHLGGQVEVIPHEDIQLTELKPFRYLFFLSAYGNMAHHTDARMMLQANVADLMYLAQQAEQMNYKQFIYVSTSSVGLPVKTEYAKTKWRGEEMMGKIFGDWPHAIIRPFTVVGRGEQKEHLIPKLIESCFEGTEMPFVPEPRHDFIDVEDVVKGILTVAEIKEVGLFELGTGMSQSNEDVRDIVSILCKEQPNTVPVESLRSYDTQFWNSKPKFWPDGWCPTKGLWKSISEMVKDYERTRKENHRHQLPA